MSDDTDLGACIKRAAYPSFYVRDLDAAVAFYSQVLGPPPFKEGDGLVGFKLGDDWLTLFDSKFAKSPGEDPRNTEFAIEVATPQDVDAVHARLVAAGATKVKGFDPTDTWMYRKMRFGCVDDPFGIRVDVFCPLPEEPGEAEAKGQAEG